MDLSDCLMSQAKGNERIEVVPSHHLERRMIRAQHSEVLVVRKHVLQVGVWRKAHCGGVEPQKNP